MQALRTIKTFGVSFLAFFLPFLGFIFMSMRGFGEITYTNHVVHSVLLITLSVVTLYTSHYAYKIYKREKFVWVFIVSLSFYVFGFIFLVHGLAIPNTFFAGINNTVFVTSESYSLFLGSLILLWLILSTEGSQKWIYKNKRRIVSGVGVALFAIYFLLLIYPNIATMAMNTARIFGALAAIPLLLSIAFLIGAYARTKNIFLLYTIIGISILLNISVVPFFYEQWSVLWWFGHLVYFSTFLVMLAGLIKGRGVAVRARRVTNKDFFLPRITAKFAFVFGLILLFILTNYYIIVRLQSLHEADAAIVDAAGRNRMLSQQIGLYAEQIIDGDESLKKELLGIINLHNTSLYALKNGGTAPGVSKDRVLPAAPPAIAPEILASEELWLQYKKAGDTIASEPTFVDDAPNPAVIAALDFIEQNSAEMLARNNAVVGKYVEFNEQKHMDLAFMMKVLALVNMLIIIAGFLIAHSIVNPIRRLSEISMKISGGNLDARAKVTTRDEVGQLASAFNQMTDGLVRANKKFKENNLKLVIQMMGAEELTKNLQDAKMATLNILEDLRTEKGKVEEEMENTKKFRQAVESSTDGIIITDVDANIVYANPAWEKITGYTLKEVLGKNPRILKSRKTPQIVYDKMWKTLTSGKPFVSEEVVNKRKDGSEYQEHISIAPIILNKKTIFYVGIKQDITARKEVDKLKSEFVTIASHQLRTPLTSIRWIIELFLKKERLTKRGKEYLHDIHTSAQKLSELVDLLLNVSRIEEGQISITPVPLDLVEFIESYLEELKPMSDKKKLAVEFKHPESLKAHTDKRVVRNIVQSIISNAIEYTMEGGKINIDLNKNEREFYLKISDTGIGIPRKEQGQIAHKFIRGSNAMLIKTDGTGMGLYIAYRAADLLGGKIRFESEENKGTTFYITLPIRSKIKSGDKKLV